MTTATKPREPAAKILTVTYLHSGSTPWVEVYRAASDSGAAPHQVRYEPRIRQWYCTCPARVICKHIRRAERLRAVRFWSVVFAGQPREVLEAERAERLSRVAKGLVLDDDLGCLDFLDLRLGERESEAA